MVNIDNKLIKRRGAIKSFARFGVLTVLGGVAVLTEAKHRRFLREGKCVGRGVCADCGAFAKCGLPLAVSVKENRQDSGNPDGGNDER